eukprot:CAMPEP_0195036512 /NCGR_PEP_ID=MMETSP0326_2-20130528/72731_1 /TAXON_ID=2866 ORGANISM="Crypthecodinium cohnii, Strain Seligo" /NCGR_SAMPLE_ID=MMETSP0326_2 /ASSEMBLY_ACC=CAM_ASM_000348 /LENGTH=42 /DNA_ID= /DNA_START= /DNA_END= /DNA_ORIENTATION=
MTTELADYLHELLIEAFRVFGKCGIRVMVVINHMANWPPITT